MSTGDDKITVRAGRPAGLETAFDTLRKFARPKKPVERCELCSLELRHEHPHLIELAARKLVCACGTCALLFDRGAGGKYKRVPQRVQLLQDFQMSDAQWDGLRLPINMAFFFKSSVEGRVVTLYPSPAGAVESLLSLEAWNDIVSGNPLLSEMEPDVEALLVDRVRQTHASLPAVYLIVPIDECYKLVGLIRGNWRGFSGGTEVWQEIGKFFAGLKERAVVIGEAQNA